MAKGEESPVRSGGMGWRTIGAIALFGLPLPALALVTGLHWAFALGLLVVVMAVWWGIGRARAGRAAGSGSALPVWGGLVALVVVAALIQAVPYRAGANPPVTAEPVWDSARTRELVVAACFDCHSNEVEYPWYADVAPMSWAVRRHVDAGRHEVNFSEWDQPQGEADESAETVEEGSMPPWYYRLSHPGLLTEQEEAELIAGLEATLGSERGERGVRDDDHEDDDD